MVKDGCDRELFEKAKLKHFSDQYIAHQISVMFEERKIEVIKTQVKRVHANIPSLKPNALSFLVEIAEFIVAARRALSFTYAIRFFLKGPKKIKYFDFIQSELEQRLGKLTKKNECNFVNLLDADDNGHLSLGENFYNHQKTIVSLKDTCNKHFNTCMTSIVNGLPELKEEFSMDSETETFTDPKIPWTCRSCKVKNNGDR